MGNKLGKRRYVVEDKYTRPQGLYQNMDVDRKKLRKLILDSKLAPCYPGDEESTLDLEECPICFLYYPSLNRSRCCMKGICTECFLQMNQQNSACSIPCPFCKTSNYGVEYRGMRTKEERGLEEMEDQKVLEAKIRIQQRERQDEERLRKKQSRITVPGEAEACEIQSSSIPESSFGYAVQQGEEFVSCEVPCSSAVNWASRSRQNRYADLAMDFESAMNSEALWHNIQTQSTEAMIPAGSSCVNLPSHPPISDFFYSRPSSGPATQAHQLYWPAHWPAARAPDSWSFSDAGCYSAGAVTGYRLPETLQEQMMLAMAEARARAGGAAWM